jgi:hypothetical protein
MPTVKIIADPDADVYLTSTELQSYPAGVSPFIAQRHIKPDAWYLSANRKHPLWLVSSIDRYAAKRAAIKAATAELNGVPAW